MTSFHHQPEAQHLKSSAIHKLGRPITPSFRREADMSPGSRPGRGYLCSSDYRDVVETLKAWGVLRAGISVQ